MSPKTKYFILYEGNRRDLFFNKKEKEPKRQDATSIKTFRPKGPLPDSTLESFIPKSTEGAIPNLYYENPYRVY